MKEFAAEFEKLVGFTLATALAAFIGAAGSLAFADKPTPRQSIWIVVCGVGTGAFGSRILEWWPGFMPIAASGAAFFLAICAMPILGLIFGIANRLKNKADRIADGGIDRLVGPAPPPIEKPPEAPKP